MKKGKGGKVRRRVRDVYSSKFHSLCCRHLTSLYGSDLLLCLCLRIFLATGCHKQQSCQYSHICFHCAYFFQFLITLKQLRLPVLHHEVGVAIAAVQVHKLNDRDIAL